LIGVALDHEGSSRIPSTVITPIAGLADALGRETDVADVVCARAVAATKTAATMNTAPRQYLPPAERTKKPDVMSRDPESRDGFNKMGQGSTPLRHLELRQGLKRGFRPSCAVRCTSPYREEAVGGVDPDRSELRDVATQYAIAINQARRTRVINDQIPEHYRTTSHINA
jgi:hypothetical protein